MNIRYISHKEETINEFLLEFHLAKAKVYKLIFEKNVLINGMVAKGNDLVYKEDVVEVIVKDEYINRYEDYNYPLDIVYEDDEFLVVNKPMNMLIHPDGNRCDTLVNAVSSYLKKKPVYFPHRLDTTTTGAILFVKNFLLESYYNYLFSTHEVYRSYLAFCEGEVSKMTIDKNIGSDRHQNGKMVVAKSGKKAITYVTPILTSCEASLVSIRLETGRTHQIRVHLSYVNHPLIGDTLYGRPSKLINRVALHSHKMEFIHPITNKKYSFTVPMPEDMLNLKKIFFKSKKEN